MCVANLIVAIATITSIICSPAEPVITDAGKLKLFDAIEKTLKTKFGELVNLPATVSILDVEFDLWKLILPSVTGGSFLFFIFFIYKIKNSFEKKLLQLKIRVRNLEKQNSDV